MVLTSNTPLAGQRKMANDKKIRKGTEDDCLALLENGFKEKKNQGTYK